MNTLRHFGFAVLSCLFGLGAAAQQPIEMGGLWDFAMGDSVYNDVVELPGSMLTNDKGWPVSTNTPWTATLYDSSFYHNPFMEPYRHEGDMKVPFFLTPAKYYVGPAWYRRSVYIPEEWNGQHVTLFLERPHIETTIWVNGKRAGHQMSLSTPHQYDLTELLKPGQRNELVIKVYNGIENVCVGQDSHSVTDHTQGNWNGVTGRMQLIALPADMYIRLVRVYPDLKHGYADVKVWMGGSDMRNFKQLLRRWSPDERPNLRVTAVTENRTKPERNISYHDITDSVFTFRLDLNDLLYPWDEFSPVFYRLTLEVSKSGDTYQTSFGMRDIEARGRKLFINERELLLRGTVENCCFPETGYPPTDVESWLNILTRCKEWGLNHVRFHSYCPPEAAFIAADRLGIYLQVEGPTWPNHGVRLRRGMAIDRYLLDESRRIIDAYGNHPSFVMMAAGNEPAGDWVSYCNDWVRQMAEYDATKLYCGASVGGGWAWDGGSQYHVKGGARGLEWDKRPPQSADDHYQQILFPRNYKAPQGKPDTIPNNTPIVTHEQGQWCVFPDLKETSQYTGAYRAGNIDIFRDLLKQGGMENMGEKFLHASGKLQTLCYKYEIERNLRTPDYAGFQLLGLNDYSGQGSAFVGPLNVHWQPKGYVTASEWQQFCAPFVPLARFPRFVYTTADTLVVPIEAYNALWGKLKKAKVTFTVTTVTQTDSARMIASGSLLPDGVSERKMRRGLTIPVGKNVPLGTVLLPLSTVAAPCQLRLAVCVNGIQQNAWDFWVYPPQDGYTPEPLRSLASTVAGAFPASSSATVTGAFPASSSDTVAGGFPAGIFSPPLYITDTLDHQALTLLAQGGNVLIEAAGKVTLGSDVKQTYLPVFWNTSWFKMRPPHTTGAYIDSSHPLFRHFPTDDWSNLNWWELLNRAQVMNLMELPADYQSPIQPIDTWHVSRKLGMMVEANVLKGKLIITTMDLRSRLDQRHVARQMRRALLAYMQSDDFRPALNLQPETINHFFTLQAPPVNMFTNESPDELKPKIH